MSRSQIAMFFVLLLFTSFCFANDAVDPLSIEEGPYEASWESLKEAPIPQWWDGGKFGIFIHWGPYSVAGYKLRHKGYAEAITRDWYQKPLEYTEFMTEKFGANTPEFGYKDMVDLYNAENWNPEQWAQLFKDAGAKYVILTAEHHDGYANWDSDLTEWCATKKGPMRDLVGDLGNSVRDAGLVYGLSYHRERHPGRYAISQTVESEPQPMVAEEIKRDPSAAGLYGPFSYTDDFIADYVLRWKELDEKYKPAFMWIDDNPIIRLAPDDPQTKKYDKAFQHMIADYLNKAEAQGREVYFNNKGKTLNYPLGVGCIEKDNMKVDSIGPRWQNPATLGCSYSYMANEEINDLYKTPNELVQLLCDVVSKNGNLLLNIGPKADGTIPKGMQTRLLAIGEWLQVNGESIYNTTHWKVYGESEGEVINKAREKKAGHLLLIKPKDIRYTKGDGCVYAHILHTENTELLLTSFTDEKVKSVEVLATNATLKYKKTNQGLAVTLPTLSNDKVQTLKITLK